MPYPGCVQEPHLGSRGVGDGLLRGECLAGDDEQGRLGVQLLQDLRYVGAVDVGDEVDLGPDGERLESLRDHERPEVGASNADVDNICDALAGETFPLAADDSPAEVLHVVQHSVDTGHHVVTADHDGSIRPAAF